jgi:penicillin-binding protein 2
MEAAVNGEGGATARIAALQDIIVCGKTGTAQNPHGKDHSVFIAFAPKDNPRIAIAVYVENAGFGATYAAPVASLMIEKYLKGEVSNKLMEQRMLELNLITGETER